MEYYQKNNLDLECKNKDGYAPIHLICDRKLYDMTSYILDIYFADFHADKKLNVECEAKHKAKTIHYVCEQSNLKNIKKIF